MRFVPSTSEMRELDRVTIEEIGLPALVLMENAGRAVADAVVRELGVAPRGPVVVVCGAGNNGGDGFVAARWLRQRGVTVTVYLAVRRDAIGGDARRFLEVFEQIGGTCVEAVAEDDLADLGVALRRAAVVVDALLGTGLGRDVTDHLARLIETMNEASDRILSIDLPSGLDGDRGVPRGIAVSARRTVALAFLKPALAVAPGFAAAGAIEVADIGIPVGLAPDRGVRLALLESADLARSVPRRDPRDHKNRAGHLLVVAGSPGKRGAARLCALAGLRGGAGLVTLASHGNDLAAADPVMTADLDADAPDLAERLAALAAGKRALALGPGMATSAGGRALVYAALELEIPLVLDADALNHLAGDLARVARARASIVMTPHPGEAARLLGIEIAAVEADRVSAARALADRAGAVVILKGPRSLVVDGLVGDGLTTINPTGNPGMATAGTGDVLTGVVGALLAQGLAPGAAARLAAYVHGDAGDRARDVRGELGMTASDLLDEVPAALTALAVLARPPARRPPPHMQ